jgi:hypothetical protein
VAGVVAALGTVVAGIMGRAGKVMAAIKDCLPPFQPGQTTLALASVSRAGWPPARL